MVRLRSTAAIVLDRQNLRRTIRIAAVIGTILFFINQFDVVVSGEASVTTWFKIGITYIVPFITSNLGVVHAERRWSKAGLND